MGTRGVLALVVLVLATAWLEARWVGLGSLPAAAPPPSWIVVATSALALRFLPRRTAGILCALALGGTLLEGLCRWLSEAVPFAAPLALAGAVGSGCCLLLHAELLARLATGPALNRTLRR